MANMTARTDSFIGNSKSTKTNSTYFFSMNNYEFPHVVKELQANARNYNIKAAKVYKSSEPSLYNVKLKKDKHSLNLTYNNNGQILSSKEVYKTLHCHSI